MGEVSTGGDAGRDPLSSDAAFELLLNASISQLENSEVRIDPAARKAARSFDDLEKERLAQAGTLRPKFFWIAAGLAAAAVMTSCALVLIVAIGNGNVSDGLGVAFITGLTVETLGILAIVGRYLFTHPPRPTTDDQT